MMTHNLNIGYYTKFKKFLLLLIALLHLSFAFCLYASVSSAAEDKPIMPPYRPAGVIPGTSLTYDKLF
ncbi:MAG: hypothetical protein LBQ58_09725, partial [Synergistaceae bacterium]|nr:hypothetical protein [Synergistaceae bacterium]